MTGGIAVILGGIGENFAAGMTGGMAFVRDTTGDFADKVNPDSVIWQRLASQYWEQLLIGNIEEHAAETGSRHAKRILQQWDVERLNFWQVCPKEMLARLRHPLSDEAAIVRA